MEKVCVICGNTFDAPKKSIKCCNSECQLIRSKTLAQTRYAAKRDLILKQQKVYNARKKLKARLSRNKSTKLQTFQKWCSECSNQFVSHRYNALVCSSGCKKVRNARLLLQRRKTDKLVDLKIRFRTLLATVVYKQKYTKNSKSERILGIPYNKLLKYLAKTYEDRYCEKFSGFDGIHIDHKIPLSSANTRQQFLELNHYTNLQLLKAYDNRQKSNNIYWKG